MARISDFIILTSKLDIRKKKENNQKGPDTGKSGMIFTSIKTMQSINFVIDYKSER